MTSHPRGRVKRLAFRMCDIRPRPSRPEARPLPPLYWPTMPEHDDGTQVAITANPFSGARRNPRLVEALGRELSRLGLDPVVIWGRDELRDAASQPDFARTFRCVVAAGGDGTLHRVVNTTTAVPVAHYPLGTENLFARHFSHPCDPAAMAQLIAAGHTTCIDLGRVESGTGNAECGERDELENSAIRNPQSTLRLFPLVASAGFDAEVIHRLDRWRCRHPQKLRRVRRSSYLRPIVAAAVSYRHPIIEVEADGERRRGALCMVFNLPRYGLGFGICPCATGDDGLLDYIVFERPGTAALASYAVAVKLGRHLRRSDVFTAKARTIRLTCPDSDPAPLEIDGEAAGFLPVEISAMPGALQVVVG